MMHRRPEYGAWIVHDESSRQHSGPELGEELWGFVPYHLLPQLMWLTQPDYTHVSYVDLKPKVTDVRIFTPEAACGGGSDTDGFRMYPSGWMGHDPDTRIAVWRQLRILYWRLRHEQRGPPLFCHGEIRWGDHQTRTFYSAYIVLDITDPDATPTVLSVYSSSTLGLTTSYPTSFA